MNKFKNFKLFPNRKTGNFLFLGAICLLIFSSIGSTTVKAEPRATFERMWVDYNINGKWSKRNAASLKLHGL